MFRCLLLAAAAIALGGCHETYGFDEGARYLQRKDTVTLSAGDAKEVNARTHMLAAWPRGVGDRRIYGNGARMVERAIVPYRSAPQSDNGGGLTAGAIAGAAAGAVAGASAGNGTTGGTTR